MFLFHRLITIVQFLQLVDEFLPGEMPVPAVSYLFDEIKEDGCENIKYSDASEIDRLAKYAVVYQKTGKLVMKLGDGDFISIDGSDTECYYELHPRFEDWQDAKNEGTAERRAKSAEDEGACVWYNLTSFLSSDC